MVLKKDRIKSILLFYCLYIIFVIRFVESKQTYFRSKLNMKRRNYPLWMLKLLYSRFFGPMLCLKCFTSKNWKDLGIDLDGNIILAVRRFSKRNDKIAINVINNGGYFTILEKGSFYV